MLVNWNKITFFVVLDTSQSRGKESIAGGVMGVGLGGPHVSQSEAKYPILNKHCGRR